MAQRVNIRLSIAGKTSSIQVPVGQWIGAAIIFAGNNPSVTGLDHIGKIYVEDQPHRVVGSRQTIGTQDEGKTFVVETSPLPVQAHPEGEGLKGGEVAIPLDFNIVTRRSEGGGWPTAVNVVGPSGKVDATLSPLEEEKYGVHFTPEEEGNHVVEVTFTVVSSLNISVGSMVPDPIQCIAYGPGLEGGEQYKPGVFTIESRNKLGKKIPVGGHNFKVQVKDPLGNNAPVEVVDNKDGTYTVTYVPSFPGKHVVGVDLNDTPIKDAPFTVDIDYSSDVASAAQSYAEGPGLENGENSTRMKGPAHFTIHAVHHDGRPKTTGGDDFDVFIEDPLFNLLTPKITDNKDGTYTVEYTPTEPGQHHIDVVLRNKNHPLDWEHIKNSPVTVDVKAGTDPSHCTADGPGLKNGILDTFPAKFTIYAKDRDNKPIKEGGDPFQVVVTDPDGKTCPVEVVDNNDGTYGVTYQPHRDGPHTVRTTLDDQDIKDSPLLVNIKPGASAKESFIEGFTLLIRTRDRNGNDIREGGQNIGTLIRNEHGEPITSVKTTDRGDGTYFVEYNLPYVAGKYVVSCTVESEDISGSPFNQTVGNVTHTAKM